MRLFLIILGIITSPMILQTEKYALWRERMVQSQIIERGITDKRTLFALRKVPRHLFLPPYLWDMAYEDTPLPIGYDQTISQPYIVALMTQSAEPGKSKKVLEIGTGSGYQAAILAEITDSVYTIEIIPELAKMAAEKFRTLGYHNIIAIYGDGYKGLPEHAPFDIIIVTAAPEDIPKSLIDQLAEGGRMVIPIGGQYSFQELVLLTKKNGKLSRKRIASVRFVPFRRLNY